MVCPYAMQPSLAAQRKTKRPRARQYAPATITSGKPIGPAHAGRISAYALDGNNLPQNQFGSDSNPFSITPFNLDGISPSVKPAPLPAAPATLTTTATTVKVPTAAAKAAAQKRSKKKRAATKKARVVYNM